MGPYVLTALIFEVFGKYAGVAREGRNILTPKLFPSFANLECVHNDHTFGMIFAFFCNLYLEGYSVSRTQTFNR